MLEPKDLQVDANNDDDSDAAADGDDAGDDENTRPPDLPSEKSVCSQEATVRTGHGTTDWLKIGKRVCQGCILSPCLFISYAE